MYFIQIKIELHIREAVALIVGEMILYAGAKQSQYLEHTETLTREDLRIMDLDRISTKLSLLQDSLPH